MKILIQIIILLVLLPQSLFANPNWQESIPDNLKPWVKWVSRDLEINKCNFNFRNFEERICSWESKLNLALNSSGGNFTYNVILDDKGTINLPGSLQFWPQAVKVNNKLEPITNINGTPTIYLEAGEYQISGDYFWATLPDKFNLPPNVALLNITLDGEKLSFPNVQNGHLTLNQSTTEVVTAEINYLDLKVFRRIEDNLPAKLETIVKLEISGKSREIKLNQISLPGFALTNISSELPINIDQQGNIIVQARAGSYTIQTESYRSAALEAVSFPTGEDWVPFELWSFASNPSLRVVDLSGASAIDPTLYNIPSEWQNLNTYKIEPTQTLQIIERKRGEAKQSSNSLNLNRVVKLNFDGSSFSIRDQVSGQIASDQHLTIDPDYNLGNVNINGIDQLITKTSTSGELVGIEVRPGDLNLTANSQVANIKELNFPGWKSEFNSISNSLYLAPGWQLFHIWGVDYVNGSWFAKWTLLDIFLVMLTVVAIFKVYNWQSSLLAFSALLLFEKTIFSITGIILFATALAALAFYVKHQRFVSFCNKFKFTIIAGTALFVLVAIFNDIKLAIHPQLKGVYFNQEADYAYGNFEGRADSVAPASQIMESADMPSASGGLIGSLSRMKKSATYESEESKVNVAKQLYQTNIDQAVQTGRGVSNWQSSNSYSFGWRTPVIQDQKIEFSLISPTQNIFLSFLRAILIMLLLARFLFNSLPFRIPMSKGLAILFCLLISQTEVMAQEADPNGIFPNDRILQDLSNYVSKNQQEAPECLPNCANIAQFEIDLEEQKFKLSFEVHSLSDSYFTLPFNRTDFSVEEITINDTSEALRLKTSGELLLVALKQGINNLVLSGTLKDRETINLAFPVIPSYGKFQVKDWIVTGISDSGKVDQVISLTKIQKTIAQKSAPDSNEKDTVKPLKLAQQFTISRQIELAYDATITTTIQRISPANSSFEIRYALLKDESLVTPGVEVKNGDLIAEFKPNEYQKTFKSILKATDKVELTAANNKIWNEIWYLSASNLWHFDYTGTPRIYFNQEIPEWHPRPGESLAIKLEKPIGIVGTTKTIESLNLTANLGKDLQKYSLNFLIKSSKGEIHPLDLPVGIEITSVKINQLAQSFKADSSKIDLNLIPGSQTIDIEWREKKALNKYYKLPEIKLNAPTANLNLNYQLSERSWVVATGGTNYGPAVLFWGYFPLAIFLAFILSRFKDLPLKFYQWCLLLIGLSQVNIGLNLMVITWFVFLGLRAKTKLSNHTLRFPLMQIFLAFWSFWAFQALYQAIKTGLLGSPVMKIAGNYSSSFSLNWYQDLTTGSIPMPWFLAFDIWYYRILMLLWALWLAASIIHWVKWGFDAYTTNGGWYKQKPKVTLPAENTDS